MTDEVPRVTTNPPKANAEQFAAKCREMARVLAHAGNFDEAIETCLMAIEEAPGDLALHQALREIALQRKAAGGKPLGMLTRWRHRRQKDPLRELIVATRLLAFDPGNRGHLARVCAAAERLALADITSWLADIRRRGIAT